MGWCGAHYYTSSHPCLWQKGQLRDLGVLKGFAFGQALGISARGQVVGVAFNSKQGGRVDEVAFSWENGKLTRLLLSLDEDNYSAVGINNRNQIVGWFSWMRDYKAFMYDRERSSAVELPRLERGWWGANAINNAGQIVGQADTIPDNGYVSHACLWQQGKAHDLGTLGGGKSGALAINSRGEIVGWSYINDGRSPEVHAFLWQQGKIRDLNTLLPKDSGWILERANGINDKGQIVGTGLHNGQRHAFLLSLRSQESLSN